MRRLTVLAMLTALVAVAPGASAAANQDVLTFVHIERAFPTFHGKIDSPDQRCVRGRTVKLFEARKHGDDVLLGADQATAKGHWKVKIAAGSGAYYAKVPRLQSRSRHLACTAATSRTLVVD